MKKIFYIAFLLCTVSKIGAMLPHDKNDRWLVLVSLAQENRSHEEQEEVGQKICAEARECLKDRFIDGIPVGEYVLLSVYGDYHVIGEILKEKPWIKGWKWQREYKYSPLS